MTSGAIHVAQVPESGWPCPLPPPLGCNLSTNYNRKRKPKWRRCVAASIAVGPSAILTGSRTRPSDRGSNARFGPVEDRRNSHRLVTVTCVIWILQIWWLSPSLSLRFFHAGVIAVPPLLLHLIDTEGLDPGHRSPPQAPGHGVVDRAVHGLPGSVERHRDLPPREPLGPTGEEPAVRRGQRTFPITLGDFLDDHAAL